MVKDTRTAAGSSDLRALNQPSPASVESEGDGVPRSVKLRGRSLIVESVADQWRIDDEWWRDKPISRMYYECVLDHGLRATLFFDLLSGKWYHQKSIGSYGIR